MPCKRCATVAHACLNWPCTRVSILDLDLHRRGKRIKHTPNACLPTYLPVACRAYLPTQLGSYLPDLDENGYLTHLGISFRVNP